MKIPFLKKKEFRPDRQRTQWLKNLWPTPTQQLRILRWVIYGLLCLIALLAQDVLLYRVNIMGGCTDVLPCVVMMIAVIQGVESGSVFALVASVLYYFSGSSAGIQVIPLLTGITVLIVIFRQAFLRRGFWTVVLCVAVGMVLYEMSLFAISLFLRLTVFARTGAVLTTAVLSLAAIPPLYPLMMAVGKLGGEAWGE